MYWLVSPQVRTKTNVTQRAPALAFKTVCCESGARHSSGMRQISTTAHGPVSLRLLWLQVLGSHHPRSWSMKQVHGNLQTYIRHRHQHANTCRTVALYELPDEERQVACFDRGIDIQAREGT